MLKDGHNMLYTIVFANEYRAYKEGARFLLVHESL